MGRQERVETQFRERLRTERDIRGWSQADVAEMLSHKGIRVYGTTIAKIEAGDRAVRIDELTGLAELFGMSVDALLGRKVGQQNYLAHTLRGALETARLCSEQVAAIQATLSDRFADVVTLDFEGFDSLTYDAAAAVKALEDASEALQRVGRFRPPRAAAVKLREPFTEHLLEQLINEVRREQD